MVRWSATKPAHSPKANSGEEGVWTPSRIKNKICQSVDEFMKELTGIHPPLKGNELVVCQDRLIVKNKCSISEILVQTQQGRQPFSRLPWSAPAYDKKEDANP